MEDEISIKTDLKEQVLRIWYRPQSERSIYDICDIDGSVIKTGDIQEDGAEIDISDLEKNEYLFLILDGDRIVKRRVNFDGKEEDA
ncbi:MAG: hypothetical protein ABEH38_10445 [Flavobacteriales bacterium]